MSGNVLVVEDEFFVALDIQDMVEELGLQFDGPYATVTEALEVLEDRLPDCAILDVQLKDGEVYPAADRLMARNVPIIFHSGHADATHLTERYPGAAVCGKPCSPGSLRDAIRRAIES